MLAAYALGHLLGVSVFLGATVMLALLLPSVGKEATDPVARREQYAAVFRIYDPIAIAALGVVVMTGAWSLTAYKAAMGPEFGRVASQLAGKLGLAFFVVMFGVYLSMGICHRIVRAAQGALPITDAGLAGQIRRLQASAWVTIAVTAFTMWYSISGRVMAGAS